MDSRKILIGICCIIIGLAIILRPRINKTPIPEGYKIEQFWYTRPASDTVPLITGTIALVDSSTVPEKRIFVQVKGMTLKEVYAMYNNGKVIP